VTDSSDSDSGSKRFAVLGAVSGFIAVAAGAFGAHGLKQRLDADLLAIFETGVRYQMFHALALFAVAWLCTRGEAAARWAGRAGWAFTGGTLVFSGTLYVLAISGVKWLGAITPLGGLALLAGWVLVAIAASR
jgi:uncharacterized membrane protein YgdD (TMEM256/DUF423 family)